MRPLVLMLVWWDFGGCARQAQITTKLSEAGTRKKGQIVKSLRDADKNLHKFAEARQIRPNGQAGISNPARTLAKLFLAINLKASFNPSTSCAGSLPRITQFRRTAADVLSSSMISTACNAVATQYSRGAAPAMQFEPELPQAKSDEVIERTIWGYWSQGYDDMSDMFKVCIETWQRHNPDWDVRILDSVSLYKYVSPNELPNCFKNMTSYQLASDAVRLALLCRYGGVWLDVNVVVRCNLDELCWSDIQSGRKTGAVFYHPYYGTEEYQKKDFTESWFLATKRGNPFFLRWRDTLCQLLHDRTDCYGLSKHPLYEGLDLSGIDVLNGNAGIANFNFKDYLAIHSMCFRLLQTEPELRLQWHKSFIKIDAAETAFKLQHHFEDIGETVGFAILTRSVPSYEFVANVPMVKFNSDHYQMAIHCPGDQLKSTTCISDLIYDCITYRDPETSGAD